MWAFCYSLLFLILVLAGTEIDLIVPNFPFAKRIYINTIYGGIDFRNKFSHSWIKCTRVIGALGDKYGKRSTILYSIVIFIIATIACIFTRIY